jgi:hypothetical protein
MSKHSLINKIKSLDNNKFKKIKLCEIFEIVSGKKFECEIVNNGKYPIISATKFNNGVLNFTDDENEKLGDLLQLVG